MEELFKVLKTVHYGFYIALGIGIALGIIWIFYKVVMILLNMFVEQYKEKQKSQKVDFSDLKEIVNKLFLVSEKHELRITRIEKDIDDINEEDKLVRYSKTKTEYQFKKE